MKKHYILYTIFFSIFSTTTLLYGQIGKGIKYFNKAQYEKAEQAFINDLEKEDEKVIAHYYLAKLYMIKDFESAYNLTKAYEHVYESVNKAQNASDNAKKKMNAQKISIMNIRKLRDDIVKVSLKEAETNKNLALYDEILSQFKDLNVAQNERAHKQRNKLAFDLAKEKNTGDAWENCWKKYHESFKKYDEAIYKSADLYLFEAYIRQYSWNAYAEFAAKYPENVYVLDKDAAIKMQLAVRKNTIEAYKDMLVAYPTSPFSTIAKDSLAAQILASDDIVQYDFFVRKYGDYSGINKIWQGLYNLYCSDKNNCNTMFYEKYYQAPKGLK